MKEITKFLATADIHGDLTLARKISQKAKEENVDFIIVAGDLGWLDELSEDVLKELSKSYKKTFILPGNHDSNTTLETLSEILPRTYNIHGRGKIEKDVGIFGAGYSTIGPFANTEKEIFENLNNSHEKVKHLEKKIMVTHEHHKDSKSELEIMKGSESTRKALEVFQPDLSIHGHIHEAGGIEESIGKTKILNAARKYKILEI